MKNIRWISICLILLVSMVSLIEGCGSKDSKGSASGSNNAEPINIGVSAPLTAQFAQNGTNMKNGIELAAKEINANGGIKGRQIKLFFEDDQGPNPTAASNAINRLISQDHVVAVIGPHFTPAMLPSEPLFEKNKIPALTGASGPAITDQKNPWIFRTRLNDNVGAKLLVKYAVENLQMKKIGLDYVNTAFGQSGIEAVKQALSEHGIVPVDIQTHQDSTKDFTSQILKFQKDEVDGIIVWTDDQPSGLLAQQMNQLGAKFKLLGSTTFSQPPFLSLAGTAANGVLSISDFSQTNPDQNIQSWVKKFEGIYHEKPELYASSYYDCMNILAEAIRQAKSIDGPSIQNALTEIKNLQGVVTTYTYSSNGDMVHSGLITEVQDVKPNVIQVVKEK